MEEDSSEVFFKGKNLLAWDDIPPELYLAIWDIVGVLILDFINYALALKHKTLHENQKTALITLL